MNTLESSIKYLIDNIIETDGSPMAEITGKNKLSESCADLTIQFTKDFIKWANKNSNGYNHIVDIWYYFDETGRYNKTTNELITTYINTLK